MLAEWTPVARSEYIAAIRWCLVTDAAEIRRRQYRSHLVGESGPVRCALSVCVACTYHRPTVSPGYWLTQLRLWHEVVGGPHTIHERPPMPWGGGALSEIYASVAASRIVAVMCPLTLREVVA